MTPRVKPPLWADHETAGKEGLSFGKAVLIAFFLEFFIPAILFSIDWPVFLNQSDLEPPPRLSVILEEIKPSEQTPLVEQLEVKEIKEKNESVENMEQIPLATIEPIPNELVSKIQIPKPKPEEKKVEEDPVKLPPLPSVFQDIKPVKKIIPKYPPSAEEEKIEGRVKVRMRVNLDGSVGSVQLVFSEPPGVFDDVVLEAAQKFIFKKDGTTYYADEVFVFIIDP